MRNPVHAAPPLLAVLAVLAIAPAVADGIQAGDLVIYNPWARATAGQARGGAAYVTIHNHGGPDRLIGAETPVAAGAEPHTHAMDGSVMKMRPVDAIVIGAGARVSLKPGGLHLMLMGLKEPLKEGASFPLTLKFERAGAIAVTARVLKPGDMGPGDPHDAHHKEGEHRGPTGDHGHRHPTQRP